MKLHRWIRLYIAIPIMLIVLIFTFNFVIDPYSMTPYNLFKIPNKFARDDRKEKVAKLYTEPAYANMLFGSSHVYTINPLVMEKYVVGRSYNAGVGTARIEDHLGFLLFLKRIGKLPKHIVLGLDFYSFNPNVETNKYFLVNDELNFLHKHAESDLYFSKFLSIDALRASYKTLHNFLNNSADKPRFDSYGTTWNASKVFTYFPETIEQKRFDEKDVDKGYDDVKSIKYESISRERLQYIEQIVALCHENGIGYTFFITPLSGQLISRINEDPTLSTTLQQFKVSLSEITGYYDFLTHNAINDNRFYFADTMHTWPFTGNLILARLFNDTNVSLPENFGVYVPRRGARP